MTAEVPTYLFLHAEGVDLELYRPLDPTRCPACRCLLSPNRSATPALPTGHLELRLSLLSTQDGAFVCDGAVAEAFSDGNGLLFTELATDVFEMTAPEVVEMAGHRPPDPACGQCGLSTGHRLGAAPHLASQPSQHAATTAQQYGPRASGVRGAMVVSAALHRELLPYGAWRADDTDVLPLASPVSATSQGVVVRPGPAPRTIKRTSPMVLQPDGCPGTEDELIEYVDLEFPGRDRRTNDDVDYVGRFEVDGTPSWVWSFWDPSDGLRCIAWIEQAPSGGIRLDGGVTVTEPIEVALLAARAMRR